MKDYRIRASIEEIARSLEGNWQEDVLFELQQAVDAYDFIERQIAACDRRLKRYLAVLPGRPKAPAEEAQAAEPASETGVTANGKKQKGKKGKKNNRESKKSAKNAPKFDLRGDLTRICGVDLTSLDGVSVMTVQTFVSELGTDMTPWPTEDNLVSWLKLAPQRGVSGGKVIKHERTKVKNRVTEALRMAASSLEHSESYLGARFRYLKSRLGPKKAIKAMAAHLARLFYRMLTRGQAWVDRGAQAHEVKRTEREKRSLQRKAAALGFRLEPAA